MESRAATLTNDCIVRAYVIYSGSWEESCVSGLCPNPLVGGVLCLLRLIVCALIYRFNLVYWKVFAKLISLVLLTTNNIISSWKMYNREAIRLVEKCLLFNIAPWYSIILLLFFSDAYLTLAELVCFQFPCCWICARSGMMFCQALFLFFAVITDKFNTAF